MSKPKIVTYIYQDFNNEVSSTHLFRRSCAHFGYEVINIAPQRYHVGNAAVLRLLHEQFKQMSGPVVYADGADTFFLREINVPTDYILYSTEKEIWPPTDELKAKWAAFYSDGKPTPWAYLNGGGYCGPAELITEFFERWILPHIDTMRDGAHAQRIQAEGFMNAEKSGFDITIDSLCLEFQSIAFQAEGDFSKHGGLLVNNLTRSKAALIHGNGRTPMGWIYDMLEL